MTPEELQRRIRDAVAYVKSLTPDQRIAGQNAGLLDRRCDPETGCFTDEWTILVR